MDGKVYTYGTLLVIMLLASAVAGAIISGAFFDGKPISMWWVVLPSLLVWLAVVGAAELRSGGRRP